MLSPEQSDFYQRRIAQLEMDLQVARTNVGYWKSLHERHKDARLSPTSLAIDLPPEMLVALHREATVRGVTDGRLAAYLVRQVITDNLFAAVLDQ